MPESTINDLYEKYTSQVEENLEDDRYFQYLFEMIQAGDNTLQQKNRVLHKVVDERWLTTVEEGINSIFNIVDIYNSDVTLYFLYSKNHPTNPEAVENLIDRYNRETLASTSANCDLLQKLLLEGRLQLRAIPDPTPDEC